MPKWVLVNDDDSSFDIRCLYFVPRNRNETHRNEAEVQVDFVCIHCARTYYVIFL